MAEIMVRKRKLVVGSFHKIKRKIGALLYYPIAQHLPASYSGFRIGQTQLRRFCGRLMLRHCGAHVNIERHAYFSPEVSLGNYSGIGLNARIHGTCEIGSYVMMGENCTIITRNHSHARTDVPMMLQGFEAEKPVQIDDDVWIGDNVTILPGVHIGKGCIIGAGAVVTHDMPDYSVSGGIPAKVIKMRT